MRYIAAPTFSELIRTQRPALVKMLWIGPVFTRPSRPRDHLAEGLVNCKNLNVNDLLWVPPPWPGTVVARRAGAVSACTLALILTLQFGTGLNGLWVGLGLEGGGGGGWKKG